MECHLCEHQGAVNAGVYRGVAFGQTPCARCKLEEKPAFDLLFRDEVGTDSGREAADGSRPARLTLDECSTRDVPFPEEECDDDPMVPLSVMSEVVSRLLAMPPLTRDVICWRFAGMPYRRIARMLGVSMAAAENRHWRAMEQWPVLRVLFAQKATKQVRRKPQKAGGGSKTGGFDGDLSESTGV